MIKSVRIENFKCIRKAEIPLEPLTVMVGPNGSGKTSVLEALHLAIVAVAGEPSEVCTGKRHCDWLYTRDGVGDLSIRCLTDHGDFIFVASPPTGHPVEDTRPFGTNSWCFPEASAILDHPIPSNIARQMAADAVSLKLNATQLARPSVDEPVLRRISHDGAGLASVLADMWLYDTRSFETLMQLMRDFVPGFRRIRFLPSQQVALAARLGLSGDSRLGGDTTGPLPGKLLLFDFDNAPNIAAHKASEGTLLLLGLLAVLLGPAKPRLLLMDDFEQGLHPLAQKALVDALRQIMRQFDDLQVIATTHSPYLLDQLRPEEVRLTTLDEEGHSVFGRLTDHPDFNRWKSEMAPGELWSLFGEKWLAQSGQGSQAG